jgi:hypothetical protein
MYTICTVYAPEGNLVKTLVNLRESEKKFTKEIGVLERSFYQCIQLPNIIWVNTRWVSENHHNDAAESIMKVRRDDRVSAAYFPKGMYYEVFCNEIEEAAYSAPSGQGGDLVVICHGIAALKSLDTWMEALRKQSESLDDYDALVSLRVFHNYYCPAEFIGLMEWRSESDYSATRIKDGYSIEETLFTGLRGGSSLLAAYNQFLCKHISMK